MKHTTNKWIILGILALALYLATNSYADRAVYYHTDEKGSTRLLSDIQASITQAYSYDVYGKPVTMYPDADTTNPYKLNSAFGVRDEGLNTHTIYHMKHRYYSARLKRFITKDPAGIDGGHNLYAYADANPVHFMDPFGLCASELDSSLGDVSLTSVMNQSAEALFDGNALYETYLNPHSNPINTLAYNMVSASKTVLSSFKSALLEMAVSTVGAAKKSMLKPARVILYNTRYQGTWSELPKQMRDYFTSDTAKTVHDILLKDDYTRNETIKNMNQYLPKNLMTYFMNIGDLNDSATDVEQLIKTKGLDVHEVVFLVHGNAETGPGWHKIGGNIVSPLTVESAHDFWEHHSASDNTQLHKYGEILPAYCSVVWSACNMGQNRDLLQAFANNTGLINAASPTTVQRFTDGIYDFGNQLNFAYPDIETTHHIHTYSLVKRDGHSELRYDPIDRNWSQYRAEKALEARKAERNRLLSIWDKVKQASFEWINTKPLP